MNGGEVGRGFWKVYRINVEGCAHNNEGYCRYFVKWYLAKWMEQIKWPKIKKSKKWLLLYPKIITQ